MATPHDELTPSLGPERMDSLPSSSQPGNGKKKKKNRGGRNRKKNKSQSVDVLASEGAASEQRPSELQPASPFRMRKSSTSSLESEALLDHRDFLRERPRRKSLRESGFTRPSLPYARNRGSQQSGLASGFQRSRLNQAISGSAVSEEGEEEQTHDRTPLLAGSRSQSTKALLSRTNSGHYGSSFARRSSANSKASSRRRLQPYMEDEDEDYDVNNPPSVPNSPGLEALDDLMLDVPPSPERSRDAIIDMDGEDRRYSDTPPEALRRRATLADLAARDVCFPGDMSEIAEEDQQSTVGSTRMSRKRTRTRQWPDLSILEEWSREEKEERTHQEHVRAKKINEPVMVGGRLRPGKTVWHREEDDAPFRFTYFNEMFDGTIHARTVSDLLQEGTTFKDLFTPDPIELDDSSDEEDADDDALERPLMQRQQPPFELNGRVFGDQQSIRQPSIVGDVSEKTSGEGSKIPSRVASPTGIPSQSATPRPFQKPKRYGPRPTFWLDVLQPTEMEMKVIAKAFGIHQLTIEDILMEEQREKVELFQSYYFLNYRSFEQDKDSEDYMDPVNFYVVVFRDGVITFHHSQTPHPANVRRRIRQLNDYMSPTADWISYAIIDDITDVYGPRVSQIEEEVDDIDEEILYLHVTSADDAEKGSKSKPSSIKNEKSGNQDQGDKRVGRSGGDMLREVGECRKKVMGLYRLLGNKADVIKGFAKRCNENWEVAPRSEIGLYLGDIQDHIVTMNNNLGHYESLLSRAHSNYVAQINIKMNERAEQNADILGKLTVIGTIVLPMNIITGMWGMNVYVPGQVEDATSGLTWFWCITAGLLAFGITCFFVAKKAYGIV